MQKIYKLYYNWLARYRLIKRYRYLIEVNEILEGYMTTKIVNGGSQEFLAKTREELVRNQQETRENRAFIQYLNSKKK